MAESTAPSEAGRGSPGWGRIALLLLIGALSGGVLVWMGGGVSLLQRLQNLDGRLLGLAFCVHYFGFALRIERWRRILGALGHSYAYLPLAGILLSGWFLSSILPARAGDFARVGALQSGRQGGPVSLADGAASLILERLFDIVAIVSMALLAALILFGGQLPGGVGTAYLLGSVVLAGLGVGLALAPGVIKWLGRRRLHPFLRRLLDFGDELLASIRILGGQPGVALLLLGQSFLIWLQDGILLWLVLAALGNPISFDAATFVALTVDLSAAIPITPGGVGQIEAAYIGLLALLSLPASVASAAVLVTRGITYWSFLIISGAATLLSGSLYFSAPGNRRRGESVHRSLS